MQEASDVADLGSRTGPLWRALLGTIVAVLGIAANCEPVGCPPATGTQPIVAGADVTIAVGQSNNCGDGDTLWSALDPRTHAQTNCWSWSNPAADPLCGGLRGSAWPLYADHRAAHLPTGNVVVIQASRAGAGLVSGQWPNKEWPKLKLRLSGMNLAASDRILFAWLHGESDAAEGRSYEAYREALELLFDDMQATYPTASAVVAVLSSHYANGSVAPIQDAQRDVAATHPFVCTSFETTALGPLPDGSHFSTDEQITQLAQLWADAAEACE